MCADTRGVDGVKGAFEDGQGELTPKAMLRVAENLRHLLLKSERLVLARPGPSTPFRTGSDYAHFANLNS
jgi:hypothetical protein